MRWGQLNEGDTEQGKYPQKEDRACAKALRQEREKCMEVYTICEQMGKDFRGPHRPCVSLNTSFTQFNN